MALAADNDVLVFEVHFPSKSCFRTKNGGGVAVLKIGYAKLLADVRVGEL